MYEKPLPVPDAETQPYWDAAKRGLLLLPKCRTCEKFFFYPRALCPHCHNTEWDWKEASGEGTIHTYTIARRGAGPAFKDDAPYVVALIDLQEGPRMLSNIVGGDPEAVQIGQKVRVTFEKCTEEITLPKFEVV